VVPWEPGVDPLDYEAAGATWLTCSAWPHEDGWLEELQAMAAAGPHG
jgi:hypothetical protein